MGSKAGVTRAWATRRVIWEEDDTQSLSSGLWASWMGLVLLRQDEVTPRERYKLASKEEAVEPEKSQRKSH